MTDFHGFVGSGKKLTEDDIDKIAEQEGIEYASLKAIIEIEANGRGFDNQGRPKMLFEPYWFYRLLSGSQRTLALRRGLAESSQPHAYPADSYPHLIAAMQINETAALRSASWGLGQVLGTNYAKAGFQSVQAMVGAMMQGEAEQLQAMLNYIANDNLLDALRRHDWTAFALGYNGRNEAAHGYGHKLAAAYEKWKARAPQDNDADDGGSDMTTQTVVKAVQQKLRDLGYFTVGKVDGLIGKRTRAAITSFQIDHDMQIDPRITNDLIAALDQATPNEPSPSRADCTVDDLRNGGSKTIQNTDGAKHWSVLQLVSGFIALVSGIISDYFPNAWDSLASVRNAFTAVPSWVWGALAMLFAAVLYQKAHNIEFWRLDDERSGRHNGTPNPAEAAQGEQSS